MTTITAVELRNNMGEIFRRVAAGEEIAVTYRGSEEFIIGVKKSQRTKETMRAALDRIKNAPRMSTLDPSKSFKELYAEHMDEKYGRIQRELEDRTR